MSELKVHKSYNRWIDEEMPTPNDDLICNEFYLKSEADKVIANKDYEIKELKNSITKLLGMDIEQVMKEVIQKTLIYGDGFVPVEHAMKLVADLRHHKAVLRHHKYRRCLAMAMWCESEMWNIRNTPLCEMFYHEVWQHDDEFWQRWYQRWQELAEKFKDKETK